VPGAADRYQHTTNGRIIPVPRIFITGSTDGLGRAAAGALISEGHDVVLHARTRERAAALSDLAPDAAGVVIGDLSSAAETRDLAGQVNQIGRMDAVIHNAAVFLEPSRAATADGHARTLAVNTLAPWRRARLASRLRPARSGESPGPRSQAKQRRDA
jgi:NAD(P)-dependent dehydrogenase (short-subunit alcohol dehydrogenase family)